MRVSLKKLLCFIKGARPKPGTFFLGAAVLLCSVLTLFLAVGAPSKESRYVANHGRMPFKTHHLYPGGAVVLEMDWLSRPEERVLLLTFDDGPNKLDLEIAALLKKQAIPALFFYVGRKVRAMPKIVEAVRAAYHEIGYHSRRHTMLSHLSQAQLTEDFALGTALLHYFGVPVRWFRPPYGDFNNRVVQTAQSFGMDTLLWSVDSRDWTGASVPTIVKNVTQQLHPGAVLLFHSTHATTLQALPAVLQAAKRAKYRFVSAQAWRRIVQVAQCRQRDCPPNPLFNRGSGGLSP